VVIENDNNAFIRSLMSLRLEEFILLVIPFLLAVTCCSQPEYLALLVLAMVVLATFLLQGAFVGGCTLNLQREAMSKEGYLPYVTNYRASMLIITAMCILAVDFPIFPRRFAKTETFGYSLMDLGVGSFVFAAGLVSPEAKKLHRQVEHQVKDDGWNKTGQTKRPLEKLLGSDVLPSLSKSLVECLPLLVLGACRLTTVKATSYHEHVTEYGVHWNFFFTLAASKVCMS